MATLATPGLVASLTTPDLVANPDTIFVDTDNGKTVDHTQVTYDGDGQQVDVWMRVISQPWTKLDLAKETNASTAAEAMQAELKGNFPSRDVAPGQILQYGLVWKQSGFDPNIEGQFVVMLTIFALLKRSGEPNWIIDQTMLTGGTFRSRTIATGALPTFFVMQLGQDKPVRDNLGMFRFTSPILTRQSNFATLHTVEATPLLPGTHYFAAIRLSNSKGQWSSLAEEFTTLRRRVEVSFHHIRIHDDGDDDTFGEDDGEVTIRLKVFEGLTEVKEFTWGEGDVSDEQGKNVLLFDPPLTYVLGPKSVTPDERTVGVNITGTEDDNLGDEHAENGLPRIHGFNVPVGRGKEQVPLVSENVVAHPVGIGSSLHFTVKVSHAIDYVA